MKKLSIFLAMAALLAACHRAIPCLSHDDYIKQKVAETSEQPKPDAAFIGKEWYCGGPAFLHLNQEKMTLSVPEELSFGHHVVFNADGSFHGTYSAQCGNDCFTTVYGNYKMATESEMQVQLDSVQQTGFCNEKGTKQLNKKLVYTLQKQEKGYLLTIKK